MGETNVMLHRTEISADMKVLLSTRWCSGSRKLDKTKASAERRAETQIGLMPHKASNDTKVFNVDHQS